MHNRIEHNGQGADPSQLEPYERLSPQEKEKDMQIIRAAVAVSNLRCTRTRIDPKQVITMAVFGEAVHKWGMAVHGSDLTALWSVIAHGGEMECVTIARIQQAVNASLLKRRAKAKMVAGMLHFRASMHKLNSSRNAIDMADLALRRALLENDDLEELMLSPDVPLEHLSAHITQELMQTVCQTLAEFEHQLEVEEILKAGRIGDTNVESSNADIEDRAKRLSQPPRSGKSSTPALISSANIGDRVKRLSMEIGADEWSKAQEAMAQIEKERATAATLHVTTRSV